VERLGCIAELLACGGCWDLAVALRWPFVVSWAQALLAWVFVVGALRLVSARWASALGLPTGRTLVKVVLVAFAVWFALGVLSAGSSLWGVFPLLAAWFVYLLVQSVRSLSRWRRDGDRGALPRLVFHACWLLAVGALFVDGVRRAKTLEHMIRFLATSPRDMATVVVPNVVQHGQDAVPLLVQKTREALEADDLMLLRSCLFCLGQIGGPEAERCLEQVVDRVIAHGDRPPFWARHAFAAYAECIGPRAVPKLKQAYERVSDRCKWAVLVALAKTASPEGVAFVFDHIDSLFAGMESGMGAWVDTAACTLDVLLSEPDTRALRSLPTHRYIYTWPTPAELADRTVREQLHQFFWFPEDRPPSLKNLRARWEANGRKFRRLWLERLSDEAEAPTSGTASQAPTSSTPLPAPLPRQ